MPDRSSAQPVGVAGVPDVGLGVAAVARRLGVAPGTLRTWARRYGVGPTGHVAGSPRRYTDTDLARLGHMRRLMLAGVTAADAARSALDQPSAKRGLRLGRSRDAAQPSAPTGPAGARPRSGGGQVIPLRDASPAARGLARAAMALDPVACRTLLDGSIARRGVGPTWQDMVLPVLAGVGDRWRATGRGVEVEHLFSESVEDALRAVTRELSEPRSAPPVLLATPEHEVHDLPLHAVAAVLAEGGLATRVLGAGLPFAALGDAVVRTGAAVVFLWARGVPGPVDVGGLAVFADVRPRPVLVLGGPGWRPARDARWVRRVVDLTGAVQTVLEGLGLDAR